MKKTTTIFNQLGVQQVISLTTIVNETLDTNFNIEKKASTFTSAQLWNIQRQRRPMLQRRNIFN
ncbi:hypothetical protein BH11BAC3_BH11BAC3_30990 [soil metagenome]